MPRGDTAVVVAPGRLLQWLGQRPLGPGLGDLLEGRHGHPAATRRGWLVRLDWHCLHALKQVEPLTRPQRHDGFLPGAGHAHRAATTADFARHVDDVDRGHLDLLRSEEHTSELQSRQYLVCRLLLEKKKNYTQALRSLRPSWDGGGYLRVGRVARVRLG